MARPTAHSLRVAGAAVLLGLQGAVAGAAPLADAMLEEDARSATLHIESAEAEGCPDVHTHWDCQLCRTLSLGHRSGAQPRVVTTLIRASRGDAPRPIRAARWPSSRRARAPPLVESNLT